MTLKTLSRIIFLSIGFIFGLFIFASLFINSRIDNLSNQWNSFDQKTVEKVALLTDIRQQIGYGGMIHNFKNYLLRQNPELLVKVYKNIRLAGIAIAKYRVLGTFYEEEKALREIESVILTYRNKIPTLEAMVLNGKAIKEIDGFVKVSDISAISAIESLQSQLLAVRASEKAGLSETIKSIKTDTSWVTIVVSALLVLSGFCIFYFMSIKVLKPLFKLKNTMLKVTEGDLRTKIPYQDNYDEVGDVAKSLQIFLNQAKELKEKDGKIKAYIEELENNKKELQEQIEKAKEANRLKDSFLATMSHEIRTPLNGIIGTAELILQSEDKAVDKDLQIILKSAESLLQIINEILDFSKIEAGQIVLEEGPFDVSEVVEDVANIASVAARRKNLDFLVKLDPLIKNSYIGDGFRLRQVLLNLANNAVKFTEAGYVVIEVSLANNSKPIDDVQQICFEVKDTGIGISHENQKRIFDNFVQADSSTTRMYGGTGLGLSICKQLVMLMGGELKLESAPAKGSVFSFIYTLPVNKEGGASESLGHVNSLKGLKACVVDDIKINRDILMGQLSHLGISSIDFESATEALNYIKMDNDSSFDIILSDFNMRYMNGAVFCKEIRKNPSFSSTPFVILTSSDSLATISEIKASGVDAYLAKPAYQYQLERVLLKVLGKKDSGLELEDVKPSKQILESLQGNRVLVVEDNQVNRDIMVQMLNRLGLESDTAEDGLRALDILKKDSDFDFILMDCHMPRMDGYEATGRIKEDETLSGIPIIAVTANAGPEDRQKCLDAQMDDFLTKPVRLGDLQAVFCKWKSINKDNERVSGVVEEVIEQKSGTNDSVDKSIITDVKDLLNEGFEDMIEKYLENSKLHIAEIIKNKDAQNVLNTIEAAHKLKSISKKVGALQLGEDADKIESILKNEQDVHKAMRDSVVYVDSLEKHYQETEKELREYIAFKERLIH